MTLFHFQTEFRVLYEAPMGTPRRTESMTYEDCVIFARAHTQGRRQIVEYIPGVIATYDDGQAEPN